MKANVYNEQNCGQEFLRLSGLNVIKFTKEQLQNMAQMRFTESNCLQNEAENNRNYSYSISCK